jgi:hypothetical protein
VGILKLSRAKNRKFFDTAPFYEKNFGANFPSRENKKQKKNIYKKCKKIPEKSWEIRAVSDEDGRWASAHLRMRTAPSAFQLGKVAW